MGQRGNEPNGSTGTDEAVATRTRRKLKQPRKYSVLLHNDDYTTMDFVVMVLMSVFHRSEAEAVRTMLQVHQDGVGVAGVYPHQVAESKVHKVESLAKQHGFPLRCTMEPEQS